MDKAGKAAIIENLRGKAEGASLAVVTDFKGMKVEEMTDLRVRLRKNDVEYLVVKNTLARIALTNGRHDAIKDKFKECCGLALASGDPVTVAKTLADFAKANKKFSIRYGSLEGRFLPGTDVERLARMPGRKELLAKALGTMNAVPTNLVCLFANMQRKLLYALVAVRDAKPQEPAA